MENNREVKVDVSEDELKAFEEAIDSEETQAPESSKEQEVEKTEEKPIEKEEESQEIEEIPKIQKEVPEVKPTIKDVEGETPREKALRLEVTRLRRERREKEQKELLKSNQSVEEDFDYSELEKLGYTSEQINDLSKVVDVIASKKGFVKKEQSYQDMANDTLKSFINEHKEYAPEYDKDDVRWSRFNEILRNDYNLKGKNSEQIKSIFERVNRDVKAELGEDIEESIKVDDKNGKIEAQKQKISVVSHGTSTTSSKSKENPVKSIPAGNKTVIIGGHPFKGFDDDEIEEFTK